MKTVLPQMLGQTRLDTAATQKNGEPIRPTSATGSLPPMQAVPARVEDQLMCTISSAKSRCATATNLKMVPWEGFWTIERFAEAWERDKKAREGMEEIEEELAVFTGFCQSALATVSNNEAAKLVQTTPC